MKKIAIFVEGESEKIFVFHLILKLYNPSKVSIECIKMYVGNNFQPDTHQHNCPEPDFEFKIINAGNDSNVVSSIFKRSKYYIEKLSYDSVIGLRDLYCDQYIKSSPNTVNQTTSSKIMREATKTINSVGLGVKVKLFFSVMELEAWYFAFHKALGRIGYPLKDINTILGLNLLSLDPEIEFYHPKMEIKKIHTSIKTTPFREVNIANAVSKAITEGEILDVLSLTNFNYFRKFLNYLLSL